MQARFQRLVFWSIPAALLAAAIGFAFWPRAVEVDLTEVRRGPMIAATVEEGETRIRDVFVLSAPIQGRALRIEIDEGDAVVAHKTVVAEIEPIDPAFLDVRSEAEARALVATAESALVHAAAELAQQRAELDFASAELARAQALHRSNTVSIRAVQDAERAFRSREAAVATAEAAVEMRRSELTAAEIRLLRPEEAMARRDNCPCVPIRAPVSGQVLRVLHESEGVVEAGQPLIEIGNPGDLEIVADFLSTEAVRIEPGQRVIIADWGGEKTLEGRVERVEPYGFTKVSALGIEEQRVNVVIGFADPPEMWRRLGHGFQVEVRVVLWEDGAAVTVPLTALFRDGDEWAVFVVSEGRAEIRHVTVGHRNDQDAEVRAGLTEGEAILRYPNDHISSGTAVIGR